MRISTLLLIFIAMMFENAVGFTCPMTCLSATDSDCGFGELKSCSETEDGQVQLYCKNPCTVISLKVSGCSREYTCGWWERMWNCLINVLPLLIRAVGRADSTYQYIVSGILILVGFWLCYRGVKDDDAIAFFIGFLMGALLGFAVGESYGFDSSTSLLYLIPFCMSGGIIFSVLFTIRENVVCYFFMGGALPATAMWFVLHMFVKDHSALLISLACGCPVTFLIFGYLFLSRRRLAMGIFTSLLGAAMIVNGGVYLAFKDNLRNCWTDTTGSMLFASLLLPLAFLGGLFSQRSLLQPERSNEKDVRLLVNSDGPYLTEVVH